MTKRGLDVEARAAGIRERLRQIARAFPGLQYAMTDASGLRFQHCVGFADLREGLAATTDNQYMAASCTKVITAAAVLSLVDAGRVELDSALSDYYADHPYGRQITVRQLIDHTSGVPNPLPINWLHRLEDSTFDEDRALATVLAAHPRLRSPPGARYRYSNLGYWLLGKVIERGSGLRYSRYVEKSLLDPCAIPRAGLCFTPEDSARLARGYERAWSPLGLFVRLAVRRTLRDGRDGPWLRFARLCMDGPAYGGLFATAAGFCGFLRAQLNKQQGAAFGWRTGILAGVDFLGKPGGGPGFCGNVRIYPSVGIATAWFANRMHVSEAKIVALTDAVDAGWFNPRPPA